MVTVLLVTLAQVLAYSLASPLAPGDLEAWLERSSWVSLGRGYCNCRPHRSQVFCDALLQRHQVECLGKRKLSVWYVFGVQFLTKASYIIFFWILEGHTGYKLLVKRFGTEAEFHTKYDPTPARRVALIRWATLDMNQIYKILRSSFRTHAGR